MLTPRSWQGYMVDLRWRLPAVIITEKNSADPPAAMLTKYDPAYFVPSVRKMFKEYEVDKEFSEHTFHNPGITNIYLKKKTQNP